MSPLAEFDRKLQDLIQQITLRILIPRWTEFDAVWEVTNKVCDRYNLGKAAHITSGRSVPQDTRPAASELIASSAEPSATDAPAQTPPPVAA